MCLITLPSNFLKTDIPVIKISIDVTNALAIIIAPIGRVVPSSPYLNIVRKTATGLMAKYISNHSSGILSKVHNIGDKKKRNVSKYFINKPTSA